MTNGLKDLLQSERGIFCLVALVFAFALVVLGRLTGEAWLDFMKWLVGALVASKTATSIVNTRTFNKPEIPQARVVTNPAPFRGEGNPEA